MLQEAFTSYEKLSNVTKNWDYHIIKVKGTSYNNVKQASPYN
jgi:hypothetical protein